MAKVPSADFGLPDHLDRLAQPYDFANVEGRSSLERAYEAVECLSRASNFGVGEPLPEVVTDMLTNLIHMCRIAGVDFDNQLRLARGHAEFEVSLSKTEPE